MDETIEKLTHYFSLYGLQILGALLTLFIGFYIARKAADFTRNRLTKSEKIDPAIALLVVKLVRGIIIIVTVVAVLDKFGVQTTSLIAVLGAAGLAIGLALQGTLTNVASGVMLLLIRPFSIGHAINVDGRVYLIDDIGLFVTKAHEPDGPYVIVPNSKIWGNTITNYSITFEDRRRINTTFGISYSDDMDKAIALIKEVIASDPVYLTDPEPVLSIDSLGDSSVNILVHVWTKREDWFPTKMKLNKTVKEAFDRNGISIPFPQRDVHLYQEK
jgi:small conductance mechanosensitive channel